MKLPNQLVLETLRSHGFSEAPTGTLREHLRKQWRQAILDGQLPAGADLPSTRKLATAFGIGRSTLVEVIDQMALEGYVITNPGGATQVAKLPKSATAAGAKRTHAEVTSDFWRLDDPPSPVVHRAFRPGLPDLSSLGDSGWASHLARRARKPISHDLSYACATGLPVLHTALLEHLRLTRGLIAEAHQVIIVPSAQAAFDIASRAAIRNGDVAWMEDPGYPGMRTLLRGAGAKIVACAIDDQGLKPPPGSERPKLIYVTPSHQYPTGITMTLSRRLQILEIAQRCDALVIEDDYDTEYQMHGQPVACLQGLDREQSVAYVGTFSKTMAPGVRAAFLVMPERYSSLAHTLAMACGQLVSVPIQLALADFLSGGGFQRHVKKVTIETRQRMAKLVQSLRALNDTRLLIPEPTGSLQICVGWSGKISDVELEARLREHSIAAVAISQLSTVSKKNGLLLGVGLVKGNEIESSVARFAKCLKEVQ